MKIVKNKEIVDYINELSDINELNISLSNLFLSVINNEITTKKEIELVANKFKKDAKDIYMDMLLEYWDISLDESENEELYSKYIYPCISELNPDDFINNPYYKNIKIENIKNKDYELVIDHYKPYELFAYKDLTSKEGVEINSLGFFKESFPFIALNYKKNTWMSITPNEISTMEKSIIEAKGDVLVLGLGLGYYAYMVSGKNEVKSVTIIEKDKEIINLFTQHILPQFEQKDKIHIIQEDAFKYMEKPINHDYVFIDLWHDTLEGIDFYLTFKKYEKQNPKVKLSYWLESSFPLLLRRAAIILLEEQLEDKKDDYYKANENNFDSLINKLYFQTKNLQISSRKDIEDFLSNIISYLL